MNKPSSSHFQKVTSLIQAKCTHSNVKSPNHAKHQNKHHQFVSDTGGTNTHLNSNQKLKPINNQHSFQRSKSTTILKSNKKQDLHTPHKNQNQNKHSTLTNSKHSHPNDNFKNHQFETQNQIKRFDRKSLTKNNSPSREKPSANQSKVKSRKESMIEIGPEEAISISDINRKLQNYIKKDSIDVNKNNLHSCWKQMMKIKQEISKISHPKSKRSNQKRSELCSDLSDDRKDIQTQKNPLDPILDISGLYNEAKSTWDWREKQKMEGNFKQWLGLLPVEIQNEFNHQNIQLLKNAYTQYLNQFTHEQLIHQLLHIQFTQLQDRYSKQLHQPGTNQKYEIIKNSEQNGHYLDELPQIQSYSRNQSNKSNRSISTTTINFYMQAAIMIQKHVRGFLGRKQVTRIKNDQKQREKDLFQRTKEEFLQKINKQKIALQKQEENRKIEKLFDYQSSEFSKQSPKDQSSNQQSSNIRNEILKIQNPIQMQIKCSDDFHHQQLTQFQKEKKHQIEMFKESQKIFDQIIPKNNKSPPKTQMKIKLPKGNLKELAQKLYKKSSKQKEIEKINPKIVKDQQQQLENIQLKEKEKDIKKEVESENKIIKEKFVEQNKKQMKELPEMETKQQLIQVNKIEQNEIVKIKGLKIKKEAIQQENEKKFEKQQGEINEILIETGKNSIETNEQEEKKIKNEQESKDEVKAAGKVSQLNQEIQNQNEQPNLTQSIPNQTKVIASLISNISVSDIQKKSKYNPIRTFPTNSQVQKMQEIAKPTQGISQKQTQKQPQKQQQQPNNPQAPTKNSTVLQFQIIQQPQQNQQAKKIESIKVEQISHNTNNIQNIQSNISTNIPDLSPIQPLATKQNNNQVLEKEKNDYLFQQYSPQSSKTQNKNQQNFFNKPNIKIEDQAEEIPDLQLTIQQAEEALILREQLINQKHQQYLRVMQQQNHTSPKSQDIKRTQIEKWFSKEQNQLNKEKNVLKKFGKTFQKVIQHTQRDMEFLKKIENKQGEDDTISFRRLFSIRSETEQSSIEKIQDQIYMDINEMEQKTENIGEHILDIILNELSHELIFAPQLQRIFSEQYEIEIPEKLMSKVQFNSSLNSVKEFLLQFCTYLSTIFSTQLIQLLNQPIGLSPADLLHTISLMDLSSDAQIYPLIKSLNDPVVPDILFTQFIQNSCANITDFEHFHSKMIFEVLNESLNNFRVLGLKGRELPWVTNSTKIYRKSINTDDELTTVLEEAVGRVLAWGSCLCGFIAENVQGGENLDIEREYLEQIREDRLAIMLEQDMNQNEYQWHQMDEEITEVGMELTDMVFEQFLEECAQELLFTMKQQQEENQEI